MHRSLIILIVFSFTKIHKILLFKTKLKKTQEQKKHYRNGKKLSLCQNMMYLIILMNKVKKKKGRKKRINFFKTYKIANMYRNQMFFK